MATRSIEGDLVIEWSSEGCGLYNGGVFSAFAMCSYLARVTFPDGRVVIIILPSGSAAKPPTSYAKQVACFARQIPTDVTRHTYLIHNLEDLT